MVLDTFILLSLYVLFRYSVSWIVYFNSIDPRFGQSIWKWTYDYPVDGKRDISDLDDKPFVRLRRKRNRAVTYMYAIVFLSFVILMSFTSNLLLFILG